MGGNGRWLSHGDVAVCGVTLFQLLWVHRDGRLARVPVEPSGAERGLLVLRSDLKTFLYPPVPMSGADREEIEGSLRDVLATVGWRLFADG